MNSIYRKLAKNNIQNNKPLYLPYMLSGMMMVAMYYLMIFLNNNPGLSGIPGFEALKIILGLGVGIIGIFAYIFVFYTNSFIIKRRKKEIGVYNILGMEKKHIAKVLALETLFVAFVDIAAGLFGGVVLSKLSLMLLYRILKYRESVTFAVTWSGIGDTILVFAILYLLTLIYNLLQIKLSNPIELLRGTNVGEREPKTKLFMAISGLVCIAVAYYIAITTDNPLQALSLFFVAALLVIVGTYELFTAGSIVVLKKLRQNKKYYYQFRHFTAVSGMLYRMKQNAAGLASICILSTMVLIVLSTTVSMYAGVGDELKSRYPSEINVYSDYDCMPEDIGSLQNAIHETVAQQGRTIENEIIYTSLPLFMTKCEDVFMPQKAVTFDASLYMVNLLTKEDFLQLNADWNTLSVPDIEPGTVYIYGMEEYDADQINLMGQNFRLAGCQGYTAAKDLYEAGLFKGDYYVLVDSAETVTQLYELQKTLQAEPNPIQNYIGIDVDGTEEEKIACSNAVQNAITDVAGTKLLERYIESRTSNKNDFFTLYGGLFFLGIFLGGMFLAVTVMIIFYKQISEGYEDRDRFAIMEKVGMSSREVKNTIESQVRMVFFLPLVTAAIHVVAAYPIVKSLLALLNLTNQKLYVICLIVTILIFTMIYYVVFRLTSRAYYKIVGNQA